MHKFKPGDYVWATTRTGIVQPAVVVSESEVEVPMAVQKCKRDDRVLVHYFPEKSEMCESGSHYVRWQLLKPFKEDFEECALRFIRKKGQVERLDAIVVAMNWQQGSELIAKLRTERGKHPRTGTCQCAVCSKVVGSTIECKGCGKAIHKKCGGPEGTCTECRDLGSSEESESLPVRSEVSPPPNPTCSFYSIPEELLQSEAVFRKLTTQAASDKDLYLLISEKQREHRTILSDFENRKFDLHNAKLGDQEFRLALFRLQEMHLKALARIKTELADQLQSARVYGFEAVKGLQKQAGTTAEPLLKEQEAYKQTQRAVIEKLLLHELRTEVPVPSRAPPKRPESKAEKNKKKKEMRSIAAVLLQPGSQCSVFGLLSQCISKIKTHGTKDHTADDELNLPLLSAIVKVAYDARLSLCSSQQYLGGSTDPEALSELLVKVRHKY